MAGRSKAMLHLNYPEGLRGTSLEAKMVYTRLLCDDALNHAGVLPLRIALWADDVELPDGEVDKALGELEDKRFAYTDYKTHQVLVRTLIRNDEICTVPNILWSACRAALNLRSRKLRRVLAAELRKLAPKPPDKIHEKTGKRYVYPDPHGTADAIDPGPPDDSERDAASHRASHPVSHPVSHPIPSRPIPRDAGSPGVGVGVGEEVSVGLNSSSVALRKRSAPRGTRIPTDFTPTPEMVSWAKERCPDVNGRLETERFVNHFEAAPGHKGVKLDWIKTWKNWFLEEQKRAEQRRPTHLRAVSGGRTMPHGYDEYGQMRDPDTGVLIER